MRIFTIGFTKKSAESFFSLLSESGATRVIDVRLRNVSQLAAFAKKDDLTYFLRKICGIEYAHVPLLAPTPEILVTYKKQGGGWDAYEKAFLALMNSRHIESGLRKQMMSDSCLLCSEAKPDYCHRRLVAEYLRDNWGDVEIVHL